MSARDEHGPWYGTGAVVRFLLSEFVGSKADAERWLAAQRQLPECVGGRLGLLTGPGDLWLAEAVYLDRRETRRVTRHVRSEEFPSFGLTWGTNLYTRKETT